MKTLAFTLPMRSALLGFGLLLAALLAVMATPARAQDAADPPGRVGRLAEVEGEVWIFDTEANEWVQATRNRPVTSGDRLSSARGARAELRVGTTTVRIDDQTELEVVTLDDDRMTLRLHSGEMAVRLRTREAARGFELLTPEGTLRPDQPGSYRVGRDDDDTEVAAFSGQMQLQADDAGVTVKAGQRYHFWNDRGTQFELIELRRDDFDAWVADREGREERSVSSRYVSAEMTGVEDLDRYGRWEQDADYGALWIPRDVGPDWAPYRMGHWVWVSPWGWTWVDDAPWGFAPFHYGRWVSRSNVWCWVPGAYVARPVYAPALVAWVGGPGVNVSINVGRRPPPTVGWFPLAPREVYVPGHRFSPHYMRGLNENQVPRGFNYDRYARDPRGVFNESRFRNRDVPRAVTYVPAHVVERRQPVAPAIIGINGRPLPGAGRDRDRPRPDAPVMPAGRPQLAQRPMPQTGVIPAAPGAASDRFGAPRAGRRDRGDADRFDRNGRNDRNDRNDRGDRGPNTGGNVNPVPTPQRVNPTPGAQVQPDRTRPFGRDEVPPLREERLTPGRNGNGQPDNGAPQRPPMQTAVPRPVEGRPVDTRPGNEQEVRRPNLWNQVHPQGQQDVQRQQQEMQQRQQQQDLQQIQQQQQMQQQQMQQQRQQQQMQQQQMQQQQMQQRQQQEQQQRQQMEQQRQQQQQQQQQQQRPQPVQQAPQVQRPQEPPRPQNLHDPRRDRTVDRDDVPRNRRPD